MEILFFNEVLKITSADVKASVKQEEIKSGTCVLNFFFEIDCKKDIYFSFDFGWYSVQLDIVH